MPSIEYACICVGAFTVRCWRISCSRVVLASSWLWSDVCCSSMERICPSCGSSSSFRLATRNDCRTTRSRRGMLLSAVTQAPQIASLQMSSKGVNTFDQNQSAQITERVSSTPFVVGFSRCLLLQGEEQRQQAEAAL